MCKKCLVAALMSGALSMEQVLRAGSLDAAIKLAQDAMGSEEESPAEWRDRSMRELSLEIKSKEAVLNYINWKLPSDSRALSIVGAAHKLTGVIQLVVVSDSPDGKYNVHEHFPADESQDHTWRAPTLEIAETIAQTVMDRLDAEAVAELKREQAEV